MTQIRRMKIVPIEHCEECPYIMDRYTIPYCALSGMANEGVAFPFQNGVVPDEIPDWCPLEWMEEK